MNAPSRSQLLGRDHFIELATGANIGFAVLQTFSRSFHLFVLSQLPGTAVRPTAIRLSPGFDGSLLCSAADSCRCELLSPGRGQECFLLPDVFGLRPQRTSERARGVRRLQHKVTLIGDGRCAKSLPLVIAAALQLISSYTAALNAGSPA